MDMKKNENTSLHPAGPGNWSFRSLTECSDCGATLGLDGHLTVRCGGRSDEQEEG